MSSEGTDFVKAQVAAHWGRRASGFDAGFGHSIRTAAERAAWDRIFDLVLAERGPLDALDAGCGTGENALYFAGRGCQVRGIDFLEEPIRRARHKATERGLSATFLVEDALTLKDWTERFDNVIDSGLFHVFSDDDRRRYVDGLATVLKPDGRLFLLCLSDEEPGEQGPRRVSKQELHDAFTQGWLIESIEPTRAEVRPDLKDLTFSSGGFSTGFGAR